MSDELTLHENHISGNCYKIRLTAAILKTRIHKLIEYNVPKGETRTTEFVTKINNNGRVPVLQVGSDTFIPESGAATYYLASGSALIPNDRLHHAQMLQWMFFEQYSVEPNLAVLRYWLFILGKDNLNDIQKSQIPLKRAAGEQALDVMEKHLEGKEWFVADRLTLADIALYGYVHAAGDGGVDLARWQNVMRWCGRIEAVDGYITLQE